MSMYDKKQYFILRCYGQECDIAETLYDRQSAEDKIEELQNEEKGNFTYFILDDYYLY